MEVGMFTMSEIEEMIVLMDGYEINGSIYLLYVRWIQGSNDCRKLLVNITEKWYVYPHGRPSICTLAYINTFKHFKLREE
jgi:hypothetical protein